MEISVGGAVIAKFFRSEELRNPGLSFYSDSQEGVQVGIWNYDAGKILLPHIHNSIQKLSDRTSEVLFIISGSVHADIYDDEGGILSEIELSMGDVLVCLTGGHGYRILEQGTQVLEVKNGPYFGPELDRRRIESKCLQSADSEAPLK